MAHDLAPIGRSNLNSQGIVPTSVPFLNDAWIAAALMHCRPMRRIVLSSDSQPIIERTISDGSGGSILLPGVAPERVPVAVAAPLSALDNDLRVKSSRPKPMLPDCSPLAYATGVKNS